MTKNCVIACRVQSCHFKMLFIASVCVQARWTVGKLNCRNCSARLGGFDFIHHFECPCGRDATIHLNKSRVDPEHKQCFLMVQPRMTKPTKEQSNLLTIESQTEESECNKTRLPYSHPKYATAICNPAVTSNSLSASENSRLFSFSPLYCIRNQRQRSLEDVATIRSSCCCSGSADTPSTWLMSADTDERAHASPAVPPQHDAAREASVSACSLIPARRHSPAHHLLQQPLGEDVSPVEALALHEDAQRASSVSAIVTEGAEQVTVCHVINNKCRCLLYVPTLQHVYMLLLQQLQLHCEYVSDSGPTIQTSSQLNFCQTGTQLTSLTYVLSLLFSFLWKGELKDRTDEAVHLDSVLSFLTCANSCMKSNWLIS